MRSRRSGGSILSSALAATALGGLGCGGGGAQDAGQDAFVAVDAARAADDAFVEVPVDAPESPDAWIAPGVDAGDGYVVFRIRMTMTGGRTPLPGVRACEVGATPENCSVGDDEGNITLGLPADADVTIRYELEGYRSFDHLLHTGPTERPRPRYNMYTQMEEDEYYAPAGGISPSMGEVFFFFESVPGVRAIEGASVTVLEPAGARVLYEDSSGLSTTATATNRDGAAIVYGLTSTEIIVRATSASGGACAPFFGGFEAPGMPGAFRLPVTLGRDTRIDMNCP